MGNFNCRWTNKHPYPVVKTDEPIWGANKTCSFGLMHFDTTRKDPQVKFESIDIDAKTHEEHTQRLSNFKVR